MNRSAWLLFASGALLATWAGSGRTARAPSDVDGSRPTHPSGSICHEPHAAVRAEIVVLRSVGEVAYLEWTVTPAIDVDSLTWRIELPDGAALVEGAAVGEAAIARGAVTVGRMTVRRPPGDEHAEVGLRVDVEFAGSDERGATREQLVVIEKVAPWGAAPSPVEVLEVPIDDRGTLLRIRPMAHVEQEG